MISRERIIYMYHTRTKFTTGVNCAERRKRFICFSLYHFILIVLNLFVLYRFKTHIVGIKTSYDGRKVVGILLNCNIYKYVNLSVIINKHLIRFKYLTQKLFVSGLYMCMYILWRINLLQLMGIVMVHIHVRLSFSLSLSLWNL